MICCLRFCNSKVNESSWNIETVTHSIHLKMFWLACTSWRHFRRSIIFKNYAARLLNRYYLHIHLWPRCNEPLIREPLSLSLPSPRNYPSFPLMRNSSCVPKSDRLGKFSEPPSNVDSIRALDPLTLFQLMMMIIIITMIVTKIIMEGMKMLI